MGKRKLETTEAWSKALGFTDLAIRVQGPGGIPMVVYPGDTGSEYIRVFTFTLMGALDDEAERGLWTAPGGEPRGWREVARVEVVRFMGGMALNDDVDLCDEADALGSDLSWAAGLFYGADGLMEAFGKLDMLLFQSVWVDPAFRGKGVAEHLWKRAVSYQDDSSLACALVFPEPGAFFRGGRGASDPLAGVDHGEAGKAKLRKMLEGWGFGAIPVPGPNSSALWLILDDGFGGHRG